MNHVFSRKMFCISPRDAAKRSLATGQESAKPFGSGYWFDINWNYWKNDGLEALNNADSNNSRDSFQRF